VRPINPRTYKITSENRLTVGEQFLPAWVDRDHGAPAVCCIPLIWARQIDLPEGHELEAWYVWDRQEPTKDWRISPRVILDGPLDTTSAIHQAAVIYEASIEETDRKYRLSCTGLFSSLRERGHKLMWVTADPPSFSVWTDFAYQAWHGKLTAAES
jgi:hypothetical protein